MIRYSNGTIIDTLYTSDGTKGQMIAQITSALTAAGWSSLGSGVYQSATTPAGLKIQVDVIDRGGSAPCICLHLRSPEKVNNAPVDGAFLFPVNGRAFRIWANKYQFFHYKSGATFTSEPCDVAFGVQSMPAFVRPAVDPIVDEDIIEHSEVVGEDCHQLVYRTWMYGPYGMDNSVRIYGHVDDDIRVNGVIWDEHMFPFYSGRHVPCDNIANGAHDFDHTIPLPAHTPLVVELISNFLAGAVMEAHVTVYAGYVFDPWCGWMTSNGFQNPPGAGNNPNQLGFHGWYNHFGFITSCMWFWDGVPYSDIGGGDVMWLVGQVCKSVIITDVSGHWEDGSVAIYEPYLVWPSGHGTSGNWSSPTRKGQLWDAMTYADTLNSEVVVRIDNKNWRNITAPVDLGGGSQIRHSLLLLIN